MGTVLKGGWGMVNGTPTKQFNIRGLCVPAKHYMADTGAKIKTIVQDYVDPGLYFVINRARQYGKTTTLSLLDRALSDRYIVIRISFEGFGTTTFEKVSIFLQEFIAQCVRRLEKYQVSQDVIDVWKKESEALSMPDLRARIINLVSSLDKNVVLMIDEVDKSSNNQLFLDFIGLLRTMYLAREEEDEPAFHSVILAGITDIRNLKRKIRSEEDHTLNSPWNIAASFDVDMSLSPGEIASMLMEYDAEYGTGMDISIVAERIHHFTSGYPFLASLLCKTIHDASLGWSAAGVDAAIKRVLTVQNTLFDDIIKNLQNHPSFANLVERIVLEGKTVEYNPDDPSIHLGVMYGILATKNNQIQIANLIFSTRLMNYFISISKTAELAKDRSARDESIYQKDGVLDFDKVLERFTVFMFETYRERDSAFIEREARRLLLGYIKPIINGQGQYFLEPEIRGGKKIDLLVQYKREEYIIELKIWRGEAYERKAFDQIAGYVKARHGRIGYVVSFCDLQTAPRQGGIFTHDGIEVHEVIVAYKDAV
jgi:hypothetical protein